MSSAQDPFYIVKEEVQDSIDQLLSNFHEWEHLASDIGRKAQLGRELTGGCESIEWQIDELEKAISVAAGNPTFYGIEEVELERRRKWTRTARDQVGTVKRSLSTGNGYSSSVELMRYPMDDSSQQARSSPFTQQNDDFISSESDRQMLLIKQQDQDLDDLSDNIHRIGAVSLTIHDELLAQEKLIDDLGTEMDSTSNRLDFLQKKVAVVMKKAGAKGQFMMIIFLLVLFIILFVLVFFT